MSSTLDAIVIPSSSPEQNWARSVSPCSPARLAGLPLPGSSPLSFWPSSEFSPGDDKIRPKSPLAMNPGKANAVLSTATARATDETSKQTTGSDTSKAKTARNRKTAKTAKAPETQNKILKGRVAKATAPKTNGSDKKHTTETKHENISSTPKRDPKVALEPEGLNLAESSRRRLDWTPPKNAPCTSLDDSCASQTSGTKPNFSDILRDYQYNQEPSVSDAVYARNDGNPTKRRRLELVDLDVQQAKPAKDQQAKLPEESKNPGTRKVRAKPKKQPITITGRMTALYQPIEESEGQQCVGEGPADDAGDDTTEKNRTKSKKRKPKKPKEPEYIILSPDVATRCLNDQNFLFGTCSQIERDDSPTFFKETQQALRVSEYLDSEKDMSESILTPSQPRSIAARYMGTKSHWFEASRDLDGSVVQPEVIDMIESPNACTSFNRTILEAQRDAVKLQKTTPSESTTYSNSTITSDPASNNAPRAETRRVSAKPTLVAVEAEVVCSVKQQHCLSRSPDMPNFNGYTDGELSKQIAAYRFKAVRGRKKMIALLEKCWQSQHGHAKSGTTEGVEAPLVITTSEKASALTSTSTAENEAKMNPSTRRKKADAEPKAASRVGKKKRADKRAGTMKMTVEIPEEMPSPIPAPKPTITLDEIQDSEEEIIPSPTRISTERKSDSRPTTPVISRLPLGNNKGKGKGKRPLVSAKSSMPHDDTLPDLLDQITKAIRLQPRPQILCSVGSQGGNFLERQLTWHEKILLYDPIVLEDFTAWLNTEGLALACEDREVCAAYVRGWCESHGVCCTYKT